MDIANVQSLSHAGWFRRRLVKIAGVQEEKLQLCPPEDWSKAAGTGLVMVANVLFTTCLYSLISHTLFASPGQIRIELIIASLCFALLVMLLDLEMYIRPSWMREGFHGLKRGGLIIPISLGDQVGRALSLMVRIALGLGLCQLSALFLSLIIFQADIDTRIQDSWRQANSHLIGPATIRVDDEIRRATDAAAAGRAAVGTLSAQIDLLRQRLLEDPSVQKAQAELDQVLARSAKADDVVRDAETYAADELAGNKRSAGNSGRPGRGARYRAAMDQVANAKTHAQETARDVNAARERLDKLRREIGPTSDATRQRNQDQLRSFEERLDSENARLSRLEDELAHLVAGRERAIRRAVDGAADHVDLDAGILRRIGILERIAEGDRKIGFLILIVDLVCFGLEMAAVLAKATGSFGTTYAALLARDTYMNITRIAEEAMVALKMDAPQAVKEAEPHNGENTAAADVASGPNPFDKANGQVPTPPKRGRGRPRKNPLPAPPVTGANGPKDPERG